MLGGGSGGGGVCVCSPTYSESCVVASYPGSRGYIVVSLNIGIKFGSIIMLQL